MLKQLSVVLSMVTNIKLLLEQHTVLKIFKAYVVYFSVVFTFGSAGTGILDMLIYRFINCIGVKHG